MNDGNHASQAYARAREDEGESAAARDPFAHELQGLPDAEFLAATRLIRRAVNRRAWHSRMAYRCASLSRILRVVEHDLGEKYRRRHKVQGGWEIEADVGARVLVVVRVEMPALRRVSDFSGPIRVIVLRADVIDVVELGTHLTFERRDGSGARAP